MQPDYLDIPPFPLVPLPLVPVEDFWGAAGFPTRASAGVLFMENDPNDGGVPLFSLLIAVTALFVKDVVGVGLSAAEAPPNDDEDRGVPQSEGGRAEVPKREDGAGVPKRGP